MARKTKIVTIETEGRDFDKAFLITELSASHAEKWAGRALLAVGQSGVSLPPGALGAGLAGLAVVGLVAFAGVPWHLAEPLLDEMMTCVQVMPDPARPQVSRALVESDIEEVSTRVQLREEVLSLHLGFSMADSITRWKSGQTPATTGDNISTTRTSLDP